jgi:NADH dehydrogenase
VLVDKTAVIAEELGQTPRPVIEEALIPYEQLRYVTCLDLGRSGAVLTHGWDRDIVMTGLEAKALKTSINSEIIYPPEGDIEALL